MFCLSGYFSEYTDLVTDFRSIWLGGETISLGTRFNGARQSEMQAAESLVPESSVFDFEMVIENLNGNK